MENEKMKILKMLEDGRITAGEASRLLETSAKPESRGSASSYQTPPPSLPPAPSPSHSYSSGNQTPPRTSSTSSFSGRSFDDFTGDMSKKFEAFAKDMEPRLQKFTEVVMEKTVSAADKISKSLATPPSPPSPPPSSAHKPYSGSTTSGPEKSFEIKVKEGYNELNISAYNGKISLKGYNGDKISARVFCQPKNSKASIELMKLGNKYFFSYDEEDFKNVNIEAYIPEFLFKKITIQTVNGPINISTITSDEINISNLNGYTELSDITFGNLILESSNSKMKLNGLKGANAKIENSGGDLSVMGLDVENVDMLNFNGSINMIIPEYARFKDYLWRVETGNAGLTMNMPGGMDLGYHVKAQTSLSSIKIGLTGMNYLYNDKTFAEAKSINYDHNEIKVKLSLETSNGPLVLN